ncbi:anaerobic C4-dicarboxylate transporter family protein [Cardinium endosymbiont of Nabis limbatus]|uniref:anaerobic C4-dicarboxylate transporter family protein n=1 Tax=Cardinium endosymbiont of Nabis limbatus TaxID=3066217 RepID=UPI003AF3E581
MGTIEAGSLNYLVQLAELCIRKHPRRIIYISPMVTYAITFLGGTNHIAYSILPVIAEVSKEVGIRPEPPFSPFCYCSFARCACQSYFLYNGYFKRIWNRNDHHF